MNPPLQIFVNKTVSVSVEAPHTLEEFLAQQGTLTFTTGPYVLDPVVLTTARRVYPQPAHYKSITDKEPQALMDSIVATLAKQGFACQRLSEFVAECKLSASINTYAPYAVRNPALDLQLRVEIFQLEGYSANSVVELRWLKGSGRRYLSARDAVYKLL